MTYIWIFFCSYKLWLDLYTCYFRFQSSYEPAVRVWDLSLDTDNVTALLAEVMDFARPLVGIRSKSNIKWYQNYPLLVAYTEVDYSSKSKQMSHTHTHTHSHTFTLTLTHTHTHTHLHSHTHTHLHSYTHLHSHTHSHTHTHTHTATATSFQLQFSDRIYNMVLKLCA